MPPEQKASSLYEEPQHRQAEQSHVRPVSSFSRSEKSARTENLPELCRHHDKIASPPQAAASPDLIGSSHVRPRSPALNLDSLRHENEIMPDISWHDILSGAPMDHPRPRSRPSSLSLEPKMNRRLSRIDLSDSDLKEILTEKRGDVVKTAASKDTKVLDHGDELSDFFCVQLVSNLSSQLADEILKSICKEATSPDLISKLIAAEMKDSGS